MTAFVAFDYDAVFDEVIAAFEITIFDFSLTTWKTVSTRKGTTKETEKVESKYSVYSKQSGVNLYRLVSFYQLLPMLISP